MDAPVKELEALRTLLEQAGRLLDEAQWTHAQHLLEQAVAIDEKDPRACELMARACAGLNRAEEAETHRNRARALRRAAWQAQVEAEARGKHELLGEKVRREIP